MLQTIELPELLNVAPPSKEAQALIAEAERRIDDFIHRRRGPLIHSFVASDYRCVDAHLRWIVGQRLAAGNAFCEWGSGFGVVALLAALHQFDACGIEVQSVLVENARRLADDFGIPAQFAQGSLIPQGGQSLEKYLDDLSYVDTNSPDGYDELGLNIDDFDLIFAFPWPGEHSFWDKLFDKFAADGALLLTYCGIEDLRLQRRVRPGR